MKKTLTLLLAFALCLTCATAAGKAKGGREKAGVYMFGLTVCLNDSSVCLTPVMRVEGAEVDGKTRFLPGCSLYGNQLKEFAESTRGGTQTPVVFYAEKRGEVEKKFLKVRKRARAEGFRLTELPAGDFRFLPVARKAAR